MRDSRKVQGLMGQSKVSSDWATALTGEHVTLSRTGRPALRGVCVEVEFVEVECVEVECGEVE